MKRAAGGVLGALAILLALPPSGQAVTLTVSPATAGPGDTVVWTVQDQPSRVVVIAYSEAPRGLHFGSLPLRLGPDAQIVFRGITDGTGLFRVSFRIPDSIREDIFYFQAGTASDPQLTAGLALSDLASLRLVFSPEQSVLAQVNFHRAKAGLPPAVLDASLSAAAALHASYLVLNRDRPEVQGLDAHTESPALPGYTPEGAAAAARSDISRGSHGPAQAVDGWMAIPYHRIPILRPNLDRIGFGTASDTSRATPYRAHVLDVLSLGGRLTLDPIRYPGAGQAGVGLAFGNEIPDPLPPGAPRPAGYTVTLQFPGSFTSVRSVSASLADGSGGPVPVYLSTPEAPARTDWPQQNTIVMIPTAPLAPGTTYTAQVAAVVDGATFMTRWSFSTVPRQSPLDVPTLPPDAFWRDGIVLDAPALAEFFNEHVVTLAGTVSGAQSVGAGFRPVGSLGGFQLRTTAPVAAGRFLLELLFQPAEVGVYEMLLFKSADGLAFQGSSSSPVPVQVF